MKNQGQNLIPMDEREPTAGNAPLPVWMFGVLLFMLFLGTMYLDRYGGGFNARVYEPYSSIEQLTELQPKTEGGEVFARGQNLYKAYCVVCHQVNGLGVPGSIPPLAGSDWVNTEGPNRIIRLVLNGLQGPILVNGTAFNGTMVPWKGTMTDDADIAAVVTFIRQNQAWGNNASAVTPEHAAAIRAEEAARSTWSPDELMRTPDK